MRFRGVSTEVMPKTGKRRTELVSHRSVARRIDRLYFKETKGIPFQLLFRNKKQKDAFETLTIKGGAGLRTITVMFFHN